MTVATALAVSWKPLTNSKAEREHERADEQQNRDPGQRAVEKKFHSVPPKWRKLG